LDGRTPIGRAPGDVIAMGYVRNLRCRRFRFHGTFGSFDQDICQGDMEMTLNRIFLQIKIAAKETPRLYFAPLIGAIKGIRAELALLDNAEKKIKVKH